MIELAINVFRCTLLIQCALFTFIPTEILKVRQKFAALQYYFWLIISNLDHVIDLGNVNIVYNLTYCNMQWLTVCHLWDCLSWLYFWCFDLLWVLNNLFNWTEALFLSWVTEVELVLDKWWSLSWEGQHITGLAY